jgi:adenosylcobinamide kinase/adenosylcobinamide-phosphate guanylyltransferase
LLFADQILESPMTLHRRILVLGGARSGKSRYAQGLAESVPLAKIFLATAQAGDREMSERIAKHRQDRDESWTTREEPLALPEALHREAGAGRIVLVDCLTLWLSNLMLAQRDVGEAIPSLASAIERASGPVILVSNEVGQGIVPATPLGRAFRDAQGRLNQAMAGCCDAVVLVTAGCPRLIKPAPAFTLELA